MTSDFAEAINTSSLDVLVPDDSTFDVANLFQSDTSGSDEPNNGVSLSTIPQRDVLYFDEAIPIYLILRSNHIQKSQLLAFIDCLTIALEVLAFTPHPKPEHGKYAPQHLNQYPHQDIIWSGLADGSQKPTVRVRNGHPAEAIWRVPVILNRPRVRLLSPRISFRPSASLSRSWTTKNSTSAHNYLPSGLPTSVNLLESISKEPALQGVVPRLPALRLSRINVSTSDSSLLEGSLSVEPQREFRVIPAITAKVRYARANSATGKPAIMATLDIETATYFDYDIRIESFHLRLSEGIVEDLGHGTALMLPMVCRPKDNPNFLFRLVPDGQPSDANLPNSNSRTLDIVIHATILASKQCEPCIEMRWRTGVDFSTSLNPTFGAPIQPLQRSKRPANISMTQVVSSEIRTPGPGQNSNQGESPNRERAVSVSDLGVSVTFIAPREIYVGEPFCWDVFVVNRSSKPRKLAVAVILKRKKGDAKAHLSMQSTSSVGGKKDNDIADAVMDETLLYAMQKNSGEDAVQIISLTNDMKIGPLVPGSCFNGELKLLPLAKGVLHVEAVRIVDAVTNDSVDVRDLPDIIASERITSESGTHH